MRNYHLIIISLIVTLHLSFTNSQQLINVNLDSVEIGVGDKEQTTITHNPVKYPTGLSKVLECDGNQKLSIKFCVRDFAKAQDITVQQALIYLINDKTNEEIIYITDQDRASKIYHKEINLNYKARDFAYQSGDYTIKLVVGDTAVAKPISWTAGKVNIQFTQEPIFEPGWLDRYLAKSEISHQFRQPEKRPPMIVSQTFTLLCLSPVLVLMFFWSKIGINFSKFTFSLSALFFHSSLLLIFVLYTLFFVKMNMFTTLKCLSGVLITSFLSGHCLLKKLASSK